MRRRPILGFVLFLGAVVGGDAWASGHDTASPSAAVAILRHLDLDSFPNSTGPRRRPSLHTPADYGFTRPERFDDGWAQVSQPGGDWYMSVFRLDGNDRLATICFTDTGGHGATYRASEVLRVTRGPSGLWTAVQRPDAVGCRNDPPLRQSSRP